MKRALVALCLSGIMAGCASNPLASPPTPTISPEALADLPRSGVGDDSPIRYLSPVDARSLRPDWDDAKWRDEIDRQQSRAKIYLVQVDEDGSIGIPIFGSANLKKGKYRIDFFVEKYINVTCPNGQGVGRVGVFSQVRAEVFNGSRNWKFAPSFFNLAVEATKKNSNLAASVRVSDSGLSGGTSTTLTALSALLSGVLTGEKSEAVMNYIGAVTAVMEDTAVIYTPMLYAYQEEVPGACDQTVKRITPNEN
ncbi:hypothetical protein [Hyphomonas jannaschiana]|uniref:hypothetical protein n=1 Tax=Hyphomonas jannaschiana TaxID=86 RepID=UPI0035C75DD3